MRKIIVVFLALIMICGLVMSVAIAQAPNVEEPGPTVQGKTAVKVAETTFVSAQMRTGHSTKDSYSLTPTRYGASGVDVSSLFTLSTPENMEDVKLSIDDQPPPVITRNGDGEFLITPAAPLSYNSLYIFRLEREDATELTWAFQTAKRFMITSTMPSATATNVPVDSGIEISFSNEDFTPIDGFFSITPEVEGSFEYHKNVAVFVPKALEHQTLYTVSIAAGIRSEGTAEVISEDYNFAFETEALEDKENDEMRSILDFQSRYGELPSTETPTVFMSFYSESSQDSKVVKFNVFKYDGTSEAISSARKLTAVPYWSQYAKDKASISTKTLKKVMSFDDKSAISNSYSYKAVTLPKKLSQGFYLIDAELDGKHEQMVLQITDLAVQVISAANKTIVWINDIATGKSVPNAEVMDVSENKTYKSNGSGIVEIDRELSVEDRLDISSGKKECVWVNVESYYYNYYGYYYHGSGNSAADYWTYLGLDRTLFKADDTVSFWGFVKERSEGEGLDFVTAKVTKGNYYDYGFGSVGSREDILTKTVAVKDGVYHDMLELPYLDAGNYILKIYFGDIALSSTHFQVQNYTKPLYKLDVSADKKAVFVDETVTFTAKAGFFEGTPVSGLDISYQVYGYGNNSYENIIVKSDLEGEVTVPITIPYSNDDYWWNSLAFRAEATFPEIGYTTKSVSIDVFVNNINLDTKVTRDGRNASLTVQANEIVLDRINNGTASRYSGDYLGAAVGGKNLSVEVVREYWEERKTGEYYDFIEKKTRPTFEYISHEEIIDRFSMVSNAEGVASKSFTVPDRERESYYVKITCVDGKGRSFVNTAYVGREYQERYQARDGRYYFDDMPESYSIGDEVKLSVMRGNEAVTGGGVLFVSMQNGIQSWQVGENPLTFSFSEEHIPNLVVNAYCFNGYNYVSDYGLSANICYNYEDSGLTLTAATDKETYKPGDMCELTLTATDANGNPKSAAVNISVVDEALFELRDYSVNTLSSLYSIVGTGLVFAQSTHLMYVPNATDDSAKNAQYYDNETAAMAAPTAEDGGAYLRELFEDTAIFKTLSTDESGKASFAFKLPDNITSWRLTISGISRDLFAGTEVQNINVTNPMFISYALNDTFLTGDVPTIGVNAYGTSLTGSETVKFEVYDRNNPDKKFTAIGSAFDRVNIPLWKMEEEGIHSLVIAAVASNGTSDALVHEYKVFKTYREIDAAVYYDVKTDTKFKLGDRGLTNITFTDKGRSQYLCQLIGMRYAYGDRIEKLAAKREANKMIAEYFPDVQLYDMGDSFEPKNYQVADGGIAMFPYAESDLYLTVKLMPYIMDDINLSSLKNYLYTCYEDEGTESKTGALYGLAMLYEPVLMDLEKYELLENMPVKDSIYIALGYYSLGETGLAEAIYDSKIAPKFEHLAPYYRINTGTDQDDILEATGLASILASHLGKPERDGLYRYCAENCTRDILTEIEKLTYISAEIDKKTEQSGQITYEYGGEKFTRELGYGYTLRVPARNFDSFKIIEVSGDVGAVSVFKQPLSETIPADDNISVSRTYSTMDGRESKIFNQGDLVRVSITVDYSAKAISGSYSVTDYLPSGLEYVNNSAKIDNSQTLVYGYGRYSAVEGQKVMFYDYNGNFEKEHTYYYYARIVNPGTFRAEGAIVQNLTANESFTLGQDDGIVINNY